MDKFPIDNLNGHLSKTYDLFLCSASFEDRCYSIPNVIQKDKYLQSIVFFNADQRGKIQENAKKLSTILSNCRLVELHSDNPVIVISRLSDSINQLSGTQMSIDVLIDVTTFTHETLLMLFRLLMNPEKKISITVCYTDAKEYSTNVTNLPDKWLTKGVGDVRNIIGYPGYINPARKNHLIILFGFEVERTQRVIEKFEADIVSVGFGLEINSISNSHYLINQTRHKQLVENDATLQSFNISLIDPHKAKDDILQQINRFPDTNIIIAPMNTKISTIGAALAFEVNPDIQLCYVKANLYNVEGYSTPGQNAYLFAIK
jgi:hypothetical protein